MLHEFENTHPLPEAFPSPFDEIGPHPVARAAALHLQSLLRRGELTEKVGAESLADDGKMFGVLVVRDGAGKVGYLRAFSGQLSGRWELDGYAPPVFDRDAREAVEPAGEKLVKSLLLREAEEALGARLLAARITLQQLEERQQAERLALRTTHQARKQQRRAVREAAVEEDELHRLEQASRADKAEKRRLEALHAAEREGPFLALKRLERRSGAHGRLRRQVCRRLMQRIHDSYVLSNPTGETSSMRSLFSPLEPPSGAGDCAGAKLLVEAHRRGLVPLALAEFWWGAPPPGGGRQSGAFYPACRDKCGPLLPFLLSPLEVSPPRKVVESAGSVHPIRVVYEDESIVVVEKPSGLLSVPGRESAASVQAWLQARHPFARLVHRLDFDTSGLLLAALDAESHRLLQQQFASREVKKRYVAWLEGEVRGDSGRIDFPMRVDLEDRPRQIHDPEHGKPAVTEWEVLERREGRTRVLLSPLTGRTHQLRVHASHRQGLGAAIVGDRLYGESGSGERLHLHAEMLGFRHPVTDEWLSFESPPSF